MTDGKIFVSTNLENKTDEQMVVLAQEGNQEALEVLLDKYRNMVTLKSNKYFIVGAERDDIFQEGMIGLFKAIRDFKKDKDNSFKTFANLCIERQLITAIKTSNRQKHMPLNSSLSLNGAAYEDDEDVELINIFNSKTMEDPLETITKREYYKIIEEKIDGTLSEFEKKVLSRYAIGDSYVKIAEKLEAPIKSVDNAIQRIRKKASKSIIEY